AISFFDFLSVRAMILWLHRRERCVQSNTRRRDQAICSGPRSSRSSTFLSCRPCVFVLVCLEFCAASRAVVCLALIRAAQHPIGFDNVGCPPVVVLTLVDVGMF